MITSVRLNKIPMEQHRTPACSLTGLSEIQWSVKHIWKHLWKFLKTFLKHFWKTFWIDSWVWNQDGHESQKGLSDIQPVECQTFLKTPLKNILANISNILNDDDEHDIDVKMEREMFINTQTVVSLSQSHSKILYGLISWKRAQDVLNVWSLNIANWQLRKSSLHWRKFDAEMENVKSFTRTNIDKLDFTPKKARKSRHFWHFKPTKQNLWGGVYCDE